MPQSKFQSNRSSSDRDTTQYTCSIHVHVREIAFPILMLLCKFCVLSVLHVFQCERSLHIASYPGLLTPAFVAASTNAGEGLVKLSHVV